MPPVLALLLTLLFIFILFWRESGEKPNFSRALWIPLVWILITGSRFVSQWLSLIGVPVGSSSVEDGSPIDAAVFFLLIIAGFHILKNRHVQLSEFVRNNRWLSIFLIYCFVAILWSDFPFVAFKRWIKILGHPIMALIILTESDPQKAMARVLKRGAYVLLPFSILFIKYFPQYGRGFDAWSGEAANIGVAHNKNELGYACLVFGLFFFWNALQAFKMKDRKAKRTELILSVGFLCMIWWLLKLASSATSLTCLLVGIATIMLLGFRFVNKRYFGLFIGVGILAFLVGEPLFGIYESTVKLLGRNLSLTDRTDIWRLALKLVDNPIFGAGFESFWLGERLKKFLELYWWAPNQAHNGYIETYLNLGYMGVFLFAAMIMETFQKAKLELLRKFEFGRLRMGFLFAILAYNYTEATFKGVHLVWTVFYLICLDYPRPEEVRVQRFLESGRIKREGASPRGTYV